MTDYNFSNVTPFNKEFMRKKMRADVYNFLIVRTGMDSPHAVFVLEEQGYDAFFEILKPRLKQLLALPEGEKLPPFVLDEV